MKNILDRIIEGQTRFDMPKGAKMSLVLKELIYTMIFVNMIELSSNITCLLGGSWLLYIHCLPCLASFGACLEVCWRFG